MKDQDRLVREEDLLADGYLRRDGCLVKQENEQEIRFIAVSHGLYDYDGIYKIEDDTNHDVLLKGVFFE